MKKTSKKLTLSRETVRALRDDRLPRIAGAALPSSLIESMCELKCGSMSVCSDWQTIFCD